MKFFEHMMRNAAPILFWISVVLFVGGLLSTFVLMGGSGSYGSDPDIRTGLIINAVYQACSAALFPFIGAAIIWSIQRRGKDGAP